MGQLVFGLCLAFAFMALPFVLFIGGIEWSTEKPLRGYLLSVAGAVLSLTVLAEGFGFAYPTKNTLLWAAMVCGAACVMARIADTRRKKKISAPQPTPRAAPFSGKNDAAPRMFDKAAADFDYMKATGQVMGEDGINREARMEDKGIHKTLSEEVRETLPKPEKPVGKGINLKYVGAAAGVVLGVLSAYKFLGNKKNDG